MSSPQIQTKRLALRHPEFRDVERLAELADDEDIASTTFIIDYPNPRQSINSWVVRHDCMADTGEGMAWIIIKEEEIVGVVTLDIDRLNDTGTLAYWIGKNYWKQGIATEASRAVLYLAFNELDIVRVMGVCMTRNPASMRVLEKIGMVCEGMLRSYQKKGEDYEDCYVYSILKEEWKLCGKQS